MGYHNYYIIHLEANRKSAQNLNWPSQTILTKSLVKAVLNFLAKSGSCPWAAWKLASSHLEM